MITAQQKTELPDGWQWQYRNPKAPCYIAEKPGQDVRSPGFPKEAEAINWAHLREAADEEEVEQPSTAIKVYVEQSELDEMERINACQKIHEGKPVEFYDYEGEPVVITGTSSSGREGVLSAEGWRIVPEKDAEGVTKPEQDGLETQSYIGTRVNVGGKSRPNWWVIVGPVYEFERKPEDDGEGFHPRFPPGFDPERAEKGLAQEAEADQVDLPQSEDPTLEDALEHALTSHVEGAATRWLGLQRNGATDAELLARIADEFQGCGGSSRNGGWRVKGGKAPKFTWFDDGPLYKAQKLTGKRLLAKVREVLEIGAPGQAADAERVCRVCGCTETDCRQCVEKTGEPCHWVEADLCSACFEPPAVAMLRALPTPAPASKASSGARSAKKRATVATPSADDKKRLHEESLARWRREPEKLPDSRKCECGETLAQHDAHAGACGLADCECEGFAPADLVDAPTEALGDSNGYHPQMLQMIPVDQIVPSPTNPRKYFDEGKLRELADSIIEHGLVEPILVRPLRRTTTGALIGGDIGETLKAWPGLASNLYYELIAGERRWRATKMAGLKVIESKVRDLDDRAALEIQMIENLQRVDISPIEEADGYSAMLELKDEKGASVYTVDSLAAKIGKKGKSKGYVYGRLKLRNLPPLALEALAKGDLPATVGELIGRLPSMEMRQEFWDEEFEGYGSDWFEMPSFRDIKLEIERSYMRELKGSPFSQTDGKLIPGVPSCAKCPKKTGNDRANYPDGRADLCTDVSCFQDKVQAHVKREAEKAKSAGANVLDEAETRAILQGAGDSSWLTSEGRRKYFELDDSPWQIEDQRTYKELLDGHLDPVIAVSPQGKTHLLAPRAEAEKILKDVHGIKPEAQRNHDTYKDSEKKRQEEKKLRQATAIEIVTRALNDVDDELFNHVKFLRIVAKLLVDHGHADVARPIAKRRGAEINAADVRGSVEKIVDGLDDADVPAFVVEWLLHGEMESWAVWGSNMAGKFPLCGYFGLKPSAVMKEVSAKLKAEAKEAAKKPEPKAKAVARA